MREKNEYIEIFINGNRATWTSKTGVVVCEIKSNGDGMLKIETQVPSNWGIIRIVKFAESVLRNIIII